MTSHTDSNPEVKKPIVREFVGVVTSDKGDKSITVRIDKQKLHPRYKKVMRLTKKLHAHDERNDANAGGDDIHPARRADEEGHGTSRGPRAASRGRRAGWRRRGAGTRR